MAGRSQAVQSLTGTVRAQCVERGWWARIGCGGQEVAGLLAWEMVWPGQGCSGHAEEWMHLREGGGLTDRPSDGNVAGGMRERGFNDDFLVWVLSYASCG